MGDLTCAKDDIQSARVSSRVVDMVVEVSPMAMVLLLATAVDENGENNKGPKRHDRPTTWTHRRECEVVLECAPVRCWMSAEHQT